MINLDANATTRPCPEAVEAATHAIRSLWANPSSVHRAGQDVRHAMELARKHVAALLGVKAREITFTSGGTESIHLAICGLLDASPNANPAIVTTDVEHAAVRDLAGDLERRDSAELRTIPLTTGGIVDLDALPGLLDGAAVVSVQWANNETGAIQPVYEIGRICREAGVPFHCDATQWVGKMPTDLSADDAPPMDLLTCSPHKFHGLKGVGVLWVRRGIRLRPPVPGSQELGRRGGTENVPGILAAGAAAQAAIAWLADESNRHRLAALRDQLERGVLEACPGAVINGPTEPDARLWNTTNIGFPRLEAETILLSMSERGVSASAGAACSSGSLDPSPVLLAMGIPPEVAHGSVRLSLSRETTEDEISRAIDVIAGAVRQLSGV